MAWWNVGEICSYSFLEAHLPCSGRVNKISLQYYMDHFDFSGMRLDVAFRYNSRWFLLWSLTLCRHLCSKLYIKGETQQVDRLLEEFSRRYWDCNPNSIYGSASAFFILQCLA